MSLFFSYNSFIFTNIIIIEVYYNVKILTTLMLNMTLHLKFIYNPKKLQQM